MNVRELPRINAVRSGVPALLTVMVIAACTHTPATDSARPGGSTDSSGAPGTQPDAGGSSRASDARRRYPLDSLPTGTIMINGSEFRVWLANAEDSKRPRVTQEGLMFVPPEEIAGDQGMFFIFPDEDRRAFWMLNTITPLDIAYARADGTIVTIQHMPPLTIETFPSIEPAMFALEVKEGTLAALGIREGDRIEYSDEILKPQP
jgi:hypothetical protein